MPDGIIRGVGEQLGQLGKQIVTDIAKTPAKIAGLDETLGVGSGKQQKGQTKPQQQTGKESVNPEQVKINQLKQTDEIEKQKQIAQARRLLQQFIEPSKQEEPSIKEKLEMEEIEKKKKEIEEEKKKAAAQLPQTGSRRPKGDLYGAKAKVHGSELGKNVKSQ